MDSCCPKILAYILNEMPKAYHKHYQGPLVSIQCVLRVQGITDKHLEGKLTGQKTYRDNITVP